MQQVALPGFLQSVGPVISAHGYLAVGGFIFLEDFGVPVPGETVLIAASIFAGAGRLNIVLVGVVGLVAAVVGDNVGYLIGRFGGHRLADRYGRYVFLTPARIARAEAFFERQGPKIIIIARFVEGLRQANGIVAGMSEMHWRRFLIFNTIGAVIWVGLWTTLGEVAGNHIGTIYAYVTRYALYSLVAAAVALAIWIFVRVRHARQERRPSLASTGEDPKEAS